MDRPEGQRARPTRKRTRASTRLGRRRVGRPAARTSLTGNRCQLAPCFNGPQVDSPASDRCLRVHSLLTLGPPPLFDTGTSPYLSPYKASRSSPDVSVSLDDAAVEAALQSFHRLESVPLGTPASKRGILRDLGRGGVTPASGSSVRFFSYVRPWSRSTSWRLIVD